MNALKYTFFSLFIFYSTCTMVADLGEIEVVRGSYPHYEMSDIFGVAKLIQSLVKNADQLKNLLQNPSDVLRATLLVGSIAAMVKVSLLAVQGLGTRIPDLTKKAAKLLISWCKRMLDIPEGFDYEQLIMSEQLFEQITAVWCEQRGAGFVSVPNVRPAHWEFQRHFVQDILNYLISFYESHQKYYRAMQLKRRSSASILHVGDHRVDHVCFLVQSILQLLKHLVQVSDATQEQGDFDIEHVKKMSRSCVILMRNLGIIIGGDPLLNNVSEYNFAGQSILPVAGLFDI